ncbi:MAG: SDR family oxidoreductase [bacterium]|nr:SDR family oxidoreductase [bacterium]
MQRILVTGANRGIGLAFVQQYLQRGERVFAACRVPRRATELQDLLKQYPDHLTLLQLIVSKQDSIDEAFEVVQAQTDALDVLINNAGIYNAPQDDNPVYGDDDSLQKLGVLTFDDALAVLRTNTVAPILIAQRFLDLLRKGDQARIVNITSGMGSLEAKTYGGSYYYATSKAALNMMTRSLAADVRRAGMIAVALDPGWVQTDMGGEDASISPEESVKHMVAFLDGLTLAQSGGFFNYLGEQNPW